MSNPMTIDIEGKRVVVRLMDDGWIINQCAGGRPFRPRQGVVWKASDRCARLPVPGDQFSGLLRQAKETYGNCAAIAWHDERVLGHIVFLPRRLARDHQATGWQFYGPADTDAGTLVVMNLAFCSLGGHEFRRKGIGKALVALMVDWAREHGWCAIEVYETSGGLFPSDWFDACIPPKPFWEARGFAVVAHRPRQFTDADLQNLVNDNPRNSAEEQEQKRDVVARLRAGLIGDDQLGSFDLRLSL